MIKGICGIFSSNISKNKAESVSGCFIDSPNGHCVINFSTFENNYARYENCIEHLSFMLSKFHDLFCNIINNTQGNDGLGCIDIFGSELIVESCAVLGEYGNGKPFSIRSSGQENQIYIANLTIISCRLDKLEIKTYYDEATGTYIETNNVYTNESNYLHHISTKKCNIINTNNQEETMYVFYVFPEFYQIIELVSFFILFEIK